MQNVGLLKVVQPIFLIIFVEILTQFSYLKNSQDNGIYENLEILKIFRNL